MTARTRLGLPIEKRVVLVTATSSVRSVDAVRAVLQLTTDREDCVVCVKSHPFEKVPIDFYKTIGESVGAKNALYFEEDFEDLLAACDVLISYLSTTILEAIIARRTTIYVNLSNLADGYPYVDHGGSLGAKTIGELGEQLDKALSQEIEPEFAESRERFLRRHLGPTTDGRGAASLAKRITECVETRREPLHT